MTRKSIPLSTIELSVVVTVFSETYSIDETLDILLGRDRNYIKEIILLASPRASEETFAICKSVGCQRTRVRLGRAEK